MFLLALLACCAGPMLAIVVLTSVLGMTLGPASALTLGLVAAPVCIALMLNRHRRTTTHPGDQP
ncbi:MAG: hypothetical protein ABIP36_03210 [Acidimicrobiales bacterium]